MATRFRFRGEIRSCMMGGAMLGAVALSSVSAFAQGEADASSYARVSAPAMTPALITVTAAKMGTAADTGRIKAQMEANLSKGFDMLRKGKQETAVKYFDRVIADADQSLAGDSRPRRCVSDDKPAAAGLVAIDDSLCDAHFGKGYALIDLGRGDLAEADLRAATEMAPQDAHFANEYAELFKSRRDWDSAYTLFERAWTVADKNPTGKDASLAARALRGMGYAKSKMGDNVAARALLEQSLTFEPKSEAAQVQLAQIARLVALGS